MNLYMKNVLQNRIIFPALAWDNLSRFRKDLLERIEKLIITIHDKIRAEKYLTDEEIPTHGQSRVIEQAKLTYSPLGKTFEKQIKTV